LPPIEAAVNNPAHHLATSILKRQSITLLIWRLQVTARSENPLDANFPPRRRSCGAFEQREVKAAFFMLILHVLFAKAVVGAVRVQVA
jgi:hypothetical protein